MEFILPTNNERIEFEDSGVKEAAQGAGDSKTLMLILAAELAISSQMGPIQKNDTSETGNHHFSPFFIGTLTCCVQLRRLIQVLL